LTTITAKGPCIIVKYRFYVRSVMSNDSNMYALIFGVIRNLKKNCKTFV